jgi:hypothetical protein
VQAGKDPWPVQAEERHDSRCEGCVAAVVARSSVAGLGSCELRDTQESGSILGCCEQRAGRLGA